MQLKVKTVVSADLKTVKEGFTQELFLALNPPFPKVKLARFDGCKKGDKVSLVLNFLLFKQHWNSDIIEDKQTEKKWLFVDVGVKLPFFLKKWRHQHEVISNHKGSTIVDDINYTTGTILTDLLMWPLMAGQFLYRKPIYKNRFRIA